jgi:SAM-dependent methyltransferase
MSNVTRLGTAGTDQYFLGYGQAEQERLQRQADELAGEARSLFARIGIPAGARVLEIGCGPRGSLDLLADVVGPAGAVLGVDRNEDAVALAQTFIAGRRLGNVEVLHRDARHTGLARATFDVVTARLVLVNVPHPEEIVKEAVALTRPGGVVAFHEGDYASYLCDPPLSAWTRLVEILSAYSGSNGIDLCIGRRVPRLLREAGLTNVRVEPIVHVYPDGHSRRPLLIDFVENLRERVIEAGLTTASELSELTSEVRRHLANPDTLVVSHLFLQAWGRRPIGA